MLNLVTVLTLHASRLGMRWGWKEDPTREFHRWVLYVDLPTGQVSFHAQTRNGGPDYTGDWDGVPGQSPQRIIRFVADIVALAPTRVVC